MARAFPAGFGFKGGGPLVGGCASLLLFACTGSTIVRTRPADAIMSIDGAQVNGNAFIYGRWIRNEYHLRVSAAGYEPHEKSVDVKVGKRAGLIAVYSPLIGLVVLPWNGEIAEEIYIDLRRADGVP